LRVEKWRATDVVVAVSVPLDEGDRAGARVVVAVAKLRGAGVRRGVRVVAVGSVHDRA